VKSDTELVNEFGEQHF